MMSRSQTHRTKIAKFSHKLCFIFACLLTITACTSGDSATTSGGASFTDVAGNWTGTVTASDSQTPATLSLSIVFTSGDVINGVANFGNSNSNCLASGTLTGTASNGSVSFVVTNSVSTITFAGTASKDHMQGTFVGTGTTSTSSDSSTTTETVSCGGISGTWKASR